MINEFKTEAIPPDDIIFFPPDAHNMGQTTGFSLWIRGRRPQPLCHPTPAATKEGKPTNFSSSYLFIYLKETQFPVMQ